MSESFFMLGALPQVQNSPVVKLHQLVNWSQIGNKLVGLYKREQTRGGGQEPYAPLSMFKLVLLGQWHGLSDAALEAALKVRLDFMVFTDFEMGTEMPDETTINRFRNRLVKAQLDTVLLAEINRQLQQHGLMVKGAHAALVDATIVASAARPQQSMEVIDCDDGNEPEVQITDSHDAEARWLKKGSKSYFGYRGYAAVDEGDGYIEHIHVTPANHAETKELVTVIRALPVVNEVLTDKGFASAQNRSLLEQHGMKDGISHKATRGHPLTAEQRQANRLIASRRFRVEQAFGTLKRRFHLSRARYFGVAKVKMQMVLASIGLNLLKAQRKLEKGQARYVF